MCSGRLDMSFILRAFSKGADGVFIGACHLNECNYITHGNYHALTMVNICRKILKHVGINPERLRMDFMSGAEANLFVEGVNDFIKTVKELGPLGKGEGIEEKALKFKLESVQSLVPYLRLVERERLRLSLKSEQAYHEFVESAEFEQLFNELIVNKLAVSQMMLLLREKTSLSTGEIAENLGLSPSEVSRHINSASRFGFVRYDVDRKRYALA